MPNLIAPGKNLGHSSLYIDFLADSKPAREFYPARDLGVVAKKLDSVNYDRSKLVQILLKQNKSFGAGDKTLSNIEKLKAPGSVAVFSGQQAVLFGGPLLIVIKALTLAKSAAELSQKLQRPVVPIFWIAGDDHDFDEANHALVLNKQTEEITVSYNTRPVEELPTSEVILSNTEELNRAKTQYKEALGESEFTDVLYTLIDSSYQVGETIVSAFGKLMAGLTAEFGLVLFNPGDAEVKRLSAKFFQRIVENQDILHETTSRTNSQLLQSGYHLQVEKSDSATHLFYNLDGRKPVLREGDKFNVADKVFSKEELMKLIEKIPEKFSPDVLTRPVFQSFLFPVLSQSGGPAEIAYLAQSGAIFELFDLPAPVYQSRPSATFVEKHFEKMMIEYKISFEELTGDIEQVVNSVMTKSFPDNLEKDFARLKNQIAESFKSFKAEAVRFDPALEGFSEQTFGKIDFALKNLESKVFAAHKKKSQDVRNRIYRLWHALFPNRGLQERSVNVGYFISKYGFEFINFMHDQIDINEKHHQLIAMTDYKTK